MTNHGWTEKLHFTFSSARWLGCNERMHACARMRIILLQHWGCLLSLAKIYKQSQEVVNSDMEYTGMRYHSVYLATAADGDVAILKLLARVEKNGEKKERENNLSLVIFVECSNRLNQALISQNVFSVSNPRCLCRRRYHRYYKDTRLGAANKSCP